MAGLFGIGGSAAKTDRKMQLASWGDLQNVFNRGANYSGTELSAGAKNLGTAGNYWQSILSGNPAAMSKALAPQISAIKGQTGQAINTLNQFGGRSGGTAAAVQEENVGAQAAIQNLIDLLGPMSAQELQSIGATELGAGTSLLGVAGGAAEGIGSMGTASRPGDQALQQDQQSAVMGGLLGLLGL